MTYFRNRPVEITLPPGGIRSFVSHHSGRFACGRLNHSFDKILMVRQGAGLLRLFPPGEQKEGIRLNPGTFLYLRAGEEHSLSDDRPMTLWGVCFHRIDPSLEPLVSSLDRVNRLPLPPLMNRFVLLCQRGWEEREGQLPYAREMLRAGLTAFLVELNRLRLSAGENRMDRIIGYLDQYYREDILLDDLAALAGCSRRRLTELFKAHTGLTTVAYLQKKRIAYAREQLTLHGNIPMAAHDAGFNDLSHFFRVFKKETAMTPKAFIRSIPPAR